MKIALVHDYIKEYGGAERVLEALHEMFPDAPVYTLVYCPEFLGPHKDRFKTWNIKTSFLQYLPFKHKFISIYRIFAYMLFGWFDFSGYDVILVSATGAYAPNNVDKKSAKQICYCHTPPRYLYGYATAREWKKHALMRILGETANHFLRMIDYRSSQNVDLFIANSKNVARRIEKFYRREAVVIYPPAVEESRIKNQELRKEDKKLNTNLLDARRYYLAGGRLARAKHYDLIVKACAELNLTLKIFGKGFAGYEEDLKSQISSIQQSQDKNLKNSSFSPSPKGRGLGVRGNIELLGEVDDNEKMELMRNAKAFIFAGEDEDFGIVPVESMSVGTPVIAYKSGGVLETVIEGKTGMFFEELTVKSLVSTLRKFEKSNIKSQDCIKQAGKFSKEKFMQQIKNQISKIKMTD